MSVSLELLKKIVIYNDPRDEQINDIIDRLDARMMTRADFVLVYNQSTDMYYVVKNRFGSNRLWIDPAKAQELVDIVAECYQEEDEELSVSIHARNAS